MTIQALKALAERTRRIDPADPGAGGAHEETLERLCELSSLVRARATAPAASCLLAACHALEALAAPDEHLAVEPLQAGAAALIEAVATTLERAGEAEDAASRAPAASVRLEAEMPNLRVAGFDDVRSARPAAARTRTGPPSEVVRNARAAADDPLLGEILIRLGHVTQAQVDAALLMHAKAGMAVGECLLMTGACPPERVLEALKMQASLRAGGAHDPTGSGPRPGGSGPGPGGSGPGPGAASEPVTPKVKAHFHVTTDIFLGEVLLGAEMITKEQLEEAMRMHHLQGVRVGEALVALGALTVEQVAGGVELQRSLQSIAAKTARPPRQST